MMVDKKGGKKGKGKNHKKKKQNEDENVGEEEEANSGTRKGVGCMAKVNEKYLDRVWLGQTIDLLTGAKI